MGEEFTLEEEEDIVIKEVQRLWLLQAGGRYKLEIDFCTAGNWVCIEGIDASINKTATLTSPDCTQDIYLPLQFNT